MKKEYEELFQSFLQFRKLHMSCVMEDLTHSEYSVLKSIDCCKKTLCKDGSQVKVSMLSELLHVNATSVSRTLKSLEEQELIERIVNKKDRRVTYVELTASGREMLQYAQKQMDAFVNAVMEQVDLAQLTVMKECMNTIYEAARKEIEKRKTDAKLEREEKNGQII